MKQKMQKLKVVSFNIEKRITKIQGEYEIQEQEEDLDTQVVPKDKTDPEPPRKEESTNTLHKVSSNFIEGIMLKQSIEIESI